MTQHDNGTIPSKPAERGRAVQLAAATAGVSLVVMALLAGVGTAFPASTGALVLMLGVAILDVIAAWALRIVFSPRFPGLAELAAYFRLAYSAALAILLAPVAAAHVSGGDAAAAWAVFDEAWVFALAIFGIHLGLIGWMMLRRTGVIARVIGGLSIIAGMLYLTDPLTRLLVPGVAVIEQAVLVGLIVTGIVGELGLAVWLTVRAKALGREASADSTRG